MGSGKYRCIMPEGSLSSLHTSFRRLNPIDPVVAMLDANNVRDLIIGFEVLPFAPTSQRLEVANKMLDEFRFVLPIIVYNGERVEIIDGRHRSLAIWHRMASGVPFLTARSMVDSIKRKLGSSDAFDEFDFTEVQYPVL